MHMDRRVVLLGPVLAAVALLVGGCFGSGKYVWQYYDECSAHTVSFVRMAECGRRKRLADCVPTNDCSPQGTAFMQFADSLVLSVKSGEMTEPEALRRFVEFKTKLFGDRRRYHALAAAAAPSPPSVCTKSGNSVFCY
jgi:hypothetical protein